MPDLTKAWFTKQRSRKTFAGSRRIWHIAGDFPDRLISFETGAKALLDGQDLAAKRYQT
jgi:hypothetical protein